jgi:hypothetical protein
MKERAITMKEEMERKIEAIEEFAEKMGYMVVIEHFSNRICERPMVWISLQGTCMPSGEPYDWAFFTDTYEELCR